MPSTVDRDRLVDADRKRMRPARIDDLEGMSLSPGATACSAALKSRKDVTERSKVGIAPPWHGTFL